jgi:rhamnose utilization protein RhaD (predicted bifunctional aldolase and dehydrogenase)
MVELFPWCAYGPGGAAPSIDTPTHGLVERPHIDHLHPDSVIALAACADGERLTAECYGGGWPGSPGSGPAGSWAGCTASCWRSTPSWRGWSWAGTG